MATTAVQRGMPVVPPEPRGGRALVVVAWVLAALLPLVGFLSLLLREQLDHQERARGQEGERDEQNPRVAAPLGGFARVV